MRINKFVALSTGMSRRAADTAVQQGRVFIDGVQAAAGNTVNEQAVVILDDVRLRAPQTYQTILLNKPEGYVVSRDGQGNRTVYDLLPPDLHQLKPIGRLDFFSSGLLLLTNDGQLAQQLTHPSNHKVKIYEITLDQPLQPLHRQMISEMGIQLEDGKSRLQLDRLIEGNDTQWQVTMHEGRNRQIRRTFQALGYHVKQLHRTTFGPYSLHDTPSGSYITL